jgi:hypothetical protein
MASMSGLVMRSEECADIRTPGKRLAAASRRSSLASATAASLKPGSSWRFRARFGPQ